MAGALYEGKYPLATALGRPLIAKLMVDVAQREGADAVAHGCTGKGNDQVRFDVTFQTLAPDLKIIAPVREGMGLTRTRRSTTPPSTASDPVSKEAPYSIDVNLWGRSMRGRRPGRPLGRAAARGLRLDGRPAEAPDEPEEVEIEFEHGVPVALDGERWTAVR